MGLGFFYTHLAETKRSAFRSRSLKTGFLAAILLFGLKFNAKAAPPSFVRGSSHTLNTVCQDGGTVSLDSYLGVNDADAGQTLTWSITSGAFFGVASGTYSTASTAGIDLPVGFTYAPNPGYTGNDIVKVAVSDGTITDTFTIFIEVQELPSLTLGAIAAVCAGGTAQIPVSGFTNVGPTPSVFAATGTPQVYVVPAGVNSLRFDVLGASGGNDNRSGTPNPGNGGRVEGVLSVVPGQTLNIYVGGRGSDGTTIGATGGYNGGGNAFNYGTVCGGAGGGASDIRIGGTGLGNRVVVAGGGGGTGWDALGGAFAGGQGGGLVGGNSAANTGGSSAGGGTQVAPGAGAFLATWTSGSAGTGGRGGNGSIEGVSGGGGGGYFGAGGGVWNGGGGGSSFANAGLASLVSHTQGYNNGDGIVSVWYSKPGTYSIDWTGDASAVFAGFTNVTNVGLPATTISVNVPAGAPASTYTGILTINNGTCNSISYPINVTVKQVPDVSLLGNETLCNGAPTSFVGITGAMGTSATYNWVNDNPSIGLAASGAGDIPSFTATNATSSQIVGNITVTPTADGCTGTPVSFTIAVDPTASLSTSLTPPAICDSTLFAYMPTSGVSGTTFAWSRADVPGIANVGSSGIDDPSEVLDNVTDTSIEVTYVYIMTNTCPDTQEVKVMVKPTPRLSSSLLPGDICSGSLFFYVPTSNTPLTTFRWVRNGTAGLTNPSDSAMGNPNEILATGTSVTAPVAVVYTYELVSGGCLNTQEVKLNVKPTPKLSSTLVATPICSGTLFNYNATSATSGATFQWNRGVIAGIMNPGMTNTGNVSETLVSSADTGVNVTYEYIVFAGGCVGTPERVTVMVNPHPKLTSSLNPSPICSNEPLNYTPLSSAGGATFSWIAVTVPGISMAAVSGTGVVTAAAVNSTDTVIMQPLYFTTTAATCTNLDTVMFTIKPAPRLTSTTTPAAICNKTPFSYLPTSNASGAVFNWSRANVSGMLNPTASGTGNPSEVLNNTTNVSIVNNYLYSIIANGCTSTPVTVSVTVHPTPTLSSPRTATVCSGSPFAYNPSSYVAGAEYDWTRPPVAGIEPGTDFGTGSVSETLTTTGIPAKYAVYLYRVTANGCTNLDSIYRVTVTVNGTPPSVGISTNATNFCSFAQYQTFAASIPPVAGVRYFWQGYNSTVWSTSADKQYALVNFYGPGLATIELTSTVISTGCITKNRYEANIGTGVADNIVIVYYNNQFVCLQANVDTYQWGYDDESLTPTVLVGETNQSYRNENPDLGRRKYWVITNRAGCTQKSYFNAPVGVEDINGVTAEIKVYPNPASENINVDINGGINGNVQVELVNMLGQKVAATATENNKATIDVRALPSGYYLVNCYQGDVKVGSTRFVKN